MFLQFIPCLLWFFILSFGLAWPLAARLRIDPAEKLVATVVLSLFGTYLITFAIYVLRLPAVAYWILPLLAAAGIVAGRRALVDTLRDADARALVIGQLLVSGWSLGWLGLVVSYSGGGWAGDWYEHWVRALFFLEHWPLDTQFLGIYALPARPPLANLVTGGLLAITPARFAHFQLFTLLLNSLAFLPAGLLARRFAPAGFRTAAIGLIALGLMLNPSFMENSTFTWTKLFTVVFILSGLYFFLRTLDPDSPRSAGPLCALALAAGILAHYSAAPYVLVLAVAWLFLNRARWTMAAFWRQTALLGGIGALVLATWFGWSLATYGAHTTLLSNSSVTVEDARKGNQLLKVALNLRDTVVPHFLRPLDGLLIAQQDPCGYWRDWLFQLYQLNLFFVFGSVGWLVLGRELLRAWSATPGRGRWFWLFFSVSVIVLGVAVHGARDTWGLAHICLQSLVVLGLAGLAARWSLLTPGWRRLLAAGAGIDFFLGIALQFFAESQTPDLGILRGERPPAILQFNGAALMNLAGKTQHGLAFFGAASGLSRPVLLVLLAVMLGLALAWLHRLTRRSVVAGGRDNFSPAPESSRQ